jgi:hypothetical protein
VESGKNNEKKCELSGRNGHFRQGVIYPLRSSNVTGNGGHAPGAFEQWMDIVLTWLEYDSVALAVLFTGIGLVTLLVLSI